MKFEYDLKRMRRKSLTITVAEGKVTVKAPPRMPLEHIEAFVDKKSAWIQKKLAEHEAKTSALSGVLDYSHILYHGAALEVVPSEAHKRVFVSDAVYVPQKHSDEEKARRAVASAFKRTALKELGARLSELSDSTGYKYKSCALTNAKGKWGSCDTHGNIKLNWRLIMLDDSLVDYVIVHELCHTVHHNHSAEFWACVAKSTPNYKAEKKLLKTYSVLTGLYR